MEGDVYVEQQSDSFNFPILCHNLEELVAFPLRKLKRQGWFTSLGWLNFLSGGAGTQIHG